MTELTDRNEQGLLAYLQGVPIDTEFTLWIKPAADALGIPRSMAYEALKTLKAARILTGLQTRYRFLVDQTEAAIRLDAWQHSAAQGVTKEMTMAPQKKLTYHERGRVGGQARWANKSPEERSAFMRAIATKKPNSVTGYPGADALHGSVPIPPDELVAAVGPEPEQPMAKLAPARKDEAGALIEAARQYAARGMLIKSHLDALTRYGLKVVVENEPAYDERLEAVGLVLAEIDSLTNQVAMWQTRYQALHDQTRDYATLKSRVESQSDQIKRLASRPQNGSAAHA